MTAFRLAALLLLAAALKTKTLTEAKALYVDRDMWEKIVLNLLSNALKFTFTGSIAVTLRWQQGQAVLAVKDSGVGVSVGYATLCEAYTLVLRRLGGEYSRQWLAEILEGAALINPDAGDYLFGAELLERFSDQLGLSKKKS